jgi:hypothetical protein
LQEASEYEYKAMHYPDLSKLSATVISFLQTYTTCQT